MSWLSIRQLPVSYVPLSSSWSFERLNPEKLMMSISPLKCHSTHFSFSCTRKHLTHTSKNVKCRVKLMFGDTLSWCLCLQAQVCHVHALQKGWQTCCCPNIIGLDQPHQARYELYSSNIWRAQLSRDTCDWSQLPLESSPLQVFLHNVKCLI